MSAHMKKKLADSGTFDAPEQDSLIMRLAAEAEVQNAQMRKAEKSSEKKTEASIREADPKNKSVSIRLGSKDPGSPRKIYNET